MDIFEKYFKGFLRTMRILGRVLFSGIYMNILQELSEFQRIFLRTYRAYSFSKDYYRLKKSTSYL